MYGVQGICRPQQLLVMVWPRSASEHRACSASACRLSSCMFTPIAQFQMHCELLTFDRAVKSCRSLLSDACKPSARQHWASTLIRQSHLQMIPIQWHSLQGQLACMRPRWLTSSHVIAPKISVPFNPDTDPEQEFVVSEWNAPFHACIKASCEYNGFGRVLEAAVQYRCSM